jgi:multiple sugar transport system permease protein
LLFISGIEKIPPELHEASTIDGANKFKQFFYVTLPLLRGVFKTNITFWSINAAGFFVWTKMFSPIQSENGTITPMVYMYELIFGSKIVVNTDAGAGAAIGCILTFCVLLIFFI